MTYVNVCLTLKLRQNSYSSLSNGVSDPEVAIIAWGCCFKIYCMIGSALWQQMISSAFHSSGVAYSSLIHSRSSGGDASNSRHDCSSASLGYPIPLLSFRTAEKCLSKPRAALVTSRSYFAALKSNPGSQLQRSGRVKYACANSKVSARSNSGSWSQS